jgi:predicted nucleotidyltransferase
VTRLVTAPAREQATRALLEALRSEPRVDRLEVFGSVAEGTADRHSDLDLGVIVADGEDVTEVAADWGRRVPELLPVFHAFSEAVGGVVLRGFLLDNFLEIDLAFSHAADWDDLPQQHPDIAGRFRSKTDFIWHDVLHAAAAIDRGRPWRALFYLERLRHGTIELASLRLGLDARHHKQADELPDAIRAALEPTLVGSLDSASLRTALEAGTRAFFAQARHLEPELADRLEARLLEYLDLIEAAESGKEG